MNKLKVFSDIKRLDEIFNCTTEISVTADYTAHSLELENRSYVPSKTFNIFHGDDSFVRLIMGPYGSGKSSGCCAEIVLRAINMIPCSDGVRRSKWLIIRNTYGELESTTLQTWLHWFGKLGNIRVNRKYGIKCVHEFATKDGKVVLELMFLAVDRAEDVKKMKSIEFTGAYLNETSELDSAVLSNVKSRINGRYPTAQMLGMKERKEGEPCPYWTGIIGDTNPPDVDSWIYRIFEVERPDKYVMYKQPPGLIEVEGKYTTNKDADNMRHIQSPSYYEDLALGETKEYIKVFCMGEYGAVISGKKVYPNYNDDLHADSGIKGDANVDIILGWDFGLTPACLIAQLSKSGQLLILKEFCTENTSVRELAQNVVYPYLKANFSGNPYTSVGDPSDRPSDSTKHSCMQVLGECGIATRKALSNDVLKRLDSVKQFLSKLIDGRPAILIDKDRCPTLRKGFLGKYNYKKLRVIGAETFREMPDKTHPFSDIQDCLQYICLEYILEQSRSKIKDDFYTPAPAWC